MTAIAIDDQTEWLETDGHGGFASGTTSGIRTRRYHALLLSAMTPPTGRIVLVNGFDAFVDLPAGRFPLSAQRYQPDVMHPDGVTRIESFVADPWPTWHFALPGGTRIRQELFMEQPDGACWLAWTLLSGDAGTLYVRPFLSGREYHALHRENGAFRFDLESCGAAVTFRPYDGVAPITLASNGSYATIPSGIATFSMSSSASAASTTRRTWRRRASSRGR